MKKNIFKFTYVALAVVAMIVIGQQQAKADFMSCMGGCTSAAQSCVNGCSSWIYGTQWICDEGCSLSFQACSDGCSYYFFGE
jgi:hypothetical protein